MMLRGKVVHFNAQMGWGFIAGENGGPDTFVHHTAIDMKGYRKLAAGDLVEYEIEQGRKGIEARNVRVIE